MLYLLGKLAAVLIIYMSIKVGYHPGLCVGGVALDSFNASTADLQLDRGAAMPIHYNKDKSENP